MSLNRTGRLAMRFGGLMLLCIIGARADVVFVGALSFDTFIPSASGLSGVNTFDVSNLTGVFSLPPDFPVSDPLTFASATLTLTLSDMSQDRLALGDIGPGFLLDGSGNPIVQVPASQTFISAGFTAILSPLAFSVSDGASFLADSTSIDLLLLPSSGPTLTADLDEAAILVPGQTITPEPATGEWTAIILACAIVARCKRSRARESKDFL
jgi:hypothetical protein